MRRDTPHPVACSVAALFCFPPPLCRWACPPARRHRPRIRLTSREFEAYLNGLKSLKAHFMQVAGNGGISEGTAWLERPGRMRFQYNPPAPFLLIAAHGVLTFNDFALQQTSNIPLSRTPLGILLADKVTLSGAVTVTGIQRLPGQIQLTLVRTDSPGRRVADTDFHRFAANFAAMDRGGRPAARDPCDALQRADGRQLRPAAVRADRYTGRESGVTP